MEALLKDYAKLDEKARELDAQKQAMRETILLTLKKEKMEKVESPYGKFTVAHKTSWEYSPAIKKLEDGLKIKKVKEQKKGLAKPVISDYLLYTKPNEEANA